MLSSLNNEKIVSAILERSGVLNVEVFDTRLSENRSCVVRSGACCYIGVDMDQVSSTAELRCLLYHELGHIATNSFYSSADAFGDQQKAERSAVRWAVTHCVPFDELVAALMNGVSNVYQLSEYFDLTIESAKKVLDYYRDKVLDYMRLFYAEEVPTDEEAS